MGEMFQSGEGFARAEGCGGGCPCRELSQFSFPAALEAGGGAQTLPKAGVRGAGSGNTADLVPVPSGMAWQPLERLHPVSL